MDQLDCLLAHDEWATSTLLKLCLDLSDDQLDQPFDIGHQSVRQTFEHMIENVEGWMAPMIGKPPETRQAPWSVADLIERNDRAYTTFAALVRRIRDEQRLDDTYIAHFNAPMRYGGAFVHVILHNDEHRTEVLHILQRLGVPDLPEVDYALWDLEIRDTA